MKITGLKIRELQGTMAYPGIFWEERLRMPIDIYPNFRKQGAEMMSSDPVLLKDGSYRV